VALVKNDAVLNEETDPSVTIARLKSEVSTLRAEIGYLKGEAGEGDELTDAERNELHSACEVYVKSRDPDETLRVAPLTLTRIRDCFALLKNMVLQAMASGGSNGDGSTDEQLRATLKVVDRVEINQSNSGTISERYTRPYPESSTSLRPRETTN